MASASAKDSSMRRRICRQYESSRAPIASVASLKRTMSILGICVCLLLPVAVSPWSTVIFPIKRVGQAFQGNRNEHSCQSICCYATGRTSLARGRVRVVQQVQEQPADNVDNNSWYPLTSVDLPFVQAQGVILAARLLKRQMQAQSQTTAQELPLAKPNSVPRQVQGRFRDLTCDAQGEQLLEAMFIDYESVLIHEGVSESIEQKLLDQQEDVLAAAVMVLQSLLVLATQVGLTGHPEQLRKLVAHLDDRFDPSLAVRDLGTWDIDSVRRLKYRVDRTPAMALLGELLHKRSPQGAFDLLLQLHIFTKHEDLALLRSGFPLRFSDEELRMADKVVHSPKHDVDSILGLRRDLRHLKVYTIDGASTSEIDDGVSVEVIEQKKGPAKHRYWVHIADAERHIGVDLWEQVARKRYTSLYLPTGSFPMLPSSISSHIMSLIAGQDAYALSMGVELSADGSIDPSSVVLTPSLIRVDYRLTYDEADEMFSEGVAYQEEWELGALFDMARRRREYRVRNGSVEGIVRNPLPFSSVTAYKDKASPDDIGISISVDISHNAGRNLTIMDDNDVTEDDYSPVSSATLLVTESMIMAGEGIGLWKKRFEQITQATSRKINYPNNLRLPFRTQPSPDFKSRAREHSIWMDLMKYNVGGGYCYTWYSRRFLQSLKIAEEPSPHSGLGLQSYVQWTSPIRRFSDLMTHRSLKRSLRRERVYNLLDRGRPIPAEVQDYDLGFPKGTLRDGTIQMPVTSSDLDNDTSPLEGLGLQGAARTLQRQSQQYWLFEYLRRLSAEDPDRLFIGVVLGTVDPERQRYAIFVDELGLEHRYTSPAARLDPGTKLRLRIDTVNPRFGILTFVQQV